MWLVVSVASVVSVVSVLQQEVTFFASRRCQGLPFCLWVSTTFRQYLWEGEGTDMAQLKDKIIQASLENVVTPVGVVVAQGVVVVAAGVVVGPVDNRPSTD